MSDTIFNPFMDDTADDTVTTMGVQNPVVPLDQTAAPTGGFDFGNFTGALSAFPFLDVGEMPEGYDIPDYLARVGAGAGSALSSLFPGVQARPQQVPGLTDLTFTRGYYGPEEDVFPSMFGTQSAGTRFWSPGGMFATAQQPTQETEPREEGESDYERGLASALGGLFGSLATAAASPQAERERLARLEAMRDVTNITVSPTFSQSQQQSMGGGTSGSQTQSGSRGGGGTTGGGLDNIPFDADLGFLDEKGDTGRDTTTIDLGGGVGPDERDFVEKPRPRTATEELIEKNYRELLGRSAEPAALEFWGNLVKSGTLTPDQLDDAIIQGAQNEDRGAVQGRRATTQEERARFGEFLNERDLNNPNLTAADRGALADIAYEKNPTPENLINNVYQNLFGRPAEQAGLDFWKAQIDAGVAPEVVARRIAAGAQNEDRTALQQVDEATWLAQNAPLRDVQTPLQQAAADFARLNPGAAVGATVQFADYLVKNNPDLVAQLANTDSLGAFADGVPFASTISAALAAEDFPEFVGKAATAGLTQVGTSTIASALGIPGAGPALAAAIALDGVLSRAFGYDSPIQDGIAWVSRQIENGVEKVGDYVEKQTKNIFNPGKWRFREGGLVDLPGGSWYNSESEEVLPEVEMFAGGGVISLVGGGKIAIGPGGGLDDLIPTSINGRRAAALSDGEFVIPADVVSMMGDGSSNEGARRLYRMVREIRQDKTGTSRQAGPLPVGKILERTMR